MHSRAARVARGAVAAAFATFVAAFSHTLAGGVAPSAFGVLASLVLSTAACALLAGRSLSLWRLTASVGVSQVLFHGLFSAVGAPVHVEHAHQALSMDAHATAAHGDMFLAHIVAGLVTLVALRFGERAFWGLAGTARLLLARLLPIAVPITPSVPRLVPPPRVEPSISFLLLSPMRHRGPPRGFAAA